MDIKDFLPELRKMIQAPLQTVMADELYSSAIIFCKESQIIRETLVPGDVKKGDKFTVSATAPSLKPWGVVTVYNDDGELKRDIHYTQHSRSEITFIDDVKGVSAIAWFYPEDRSVIPEVVSSYGQEIAHGAAAALFIQPAKSWTDGSQYNHHHRLFVEGYRQAWRDQLEQFGTFQNPQIKNSYWM